MSGRGVDTTQSVIEKDLFDYLNEEQSYEAHSIINGQSVGSGHNQVLNPAKLEQVVGVISEITAKDVQTAVDGAAASSWAHSTTPEKRAHILRKAADLLESEMNEFLKLCVLEAGKTIDDAIAEVREAIDFCRYYADQAESEVYASRKPLGVVACISPWNFPVAIFLGQVVAALSMGNTVVAKPAPQTPLIAYKGINLLIRAGVYPDAVHLLLGPPVEIGNALTQNPAIAGMCFTGSTQTSKVIATGLAGTGRANTPFIAETGGINAMIIDSTALLEQAVQDVIDSAFLSSGQRCSACRIVCVQSDIADDFKEMLAGAMKLLKVGNPVEIDTDMGPVIDSAASNKIRSYTQKMAEQYEVVGRISVDTLQHTGHFVLPFAVNVGSIANVKQEVFGPVLHIVEFDGDELYQIVDEINGLGYGLTMGLHTRLDSRVERVAKRAKVGNLYVNRNQVGAVVGVQPFGGEALSGTGPKAGGPHYLLQLSKGDTDEKLPNVLNEYDEATTPSAELCKTVAQVYAAHEDWSGTFDTQQRRVLVREAFEKVSALGDAFWNELNTETQTDLPGPTGEKNTLRLFPRGVIYCAGCDKEDPHCLERQVAKSLVSGSGVVLVRPEAVQLDVDAIKTKLVRNGAPADLITFVSETDAICVIETDIGAVVAEGSIKMEMSARRNLRAGAQIPVLSQNDPMERFYLERVLTVNTTAAGGNATLLSEV